MEFRISMTSPDLDATEVEFNCPLCGFENTATLGEVLGRETHICARCGRVIRLEDEGDSLARKVDEINRRVEDLDKIIGRYNR